MLLHFMKFHFMVSRRSRGLRFGAENWSNRCDALAFTSLPLEAQVIRTLSGQIILRNLLFTLLLYLCIRYLLYTSIYMTSSTMTKRLIFSKLYICKFVRLWIRSTWINSRSSSIQLYRIQNKYMNYWLLYITISFSSFAKIDLHISLCNN